jgi:N,N-dimethylformamidase
MPEPMLRAATIHGYADRLSVAPGETIEFKVSCDEPGSYRADLVRLVHGDTNPAGPGFKEEAIASAVNGAYEGRHQPIRSGSHVIVDDPGGELALTGAFTLHAFVYPTTPGKDGQCILGRRDAESGAGYALTIEGGRLTLRIGDASVAAGVPLWASCWYSVAGTYDPATGQATIYQEPVRNSYNSLLSPMVAIPERARGSQAAASGPEDAGAPFVIAGCGSAAASDGLDTHVSAHYNGKIDAPKAYARALSEAELDALSSGGDAPAPGLLAHWDFAVGIGPRGVATDVVADVGGNGLAGTCVNQPVRGMTGWNWDCSEECYRHAPKLYGAIHFHDDDLDDCRWETDLALEVPADLGSNVYALRLVQGEAEEYIPFFVLPPRGTATADILLLVPTASYLAYANDHIVHDVPVAQSILGHTTCISEQDFYVYGSLDIGLSTYDAHSDGSGVCFSSSRRPIINMSPKFRHATGSVWQFPADLHLVDWLHAEGYSYDVATDLELHREGADLLRRYRVVLTGSHPEYYSERMLDAWQAYLGAGGRGMYLGSNGFYWVTSWHPEKPWLIEVRKCESGSRAWQAKPGEYYHATSGERGGLWRSRARAPQKLFGVGFTSEGFDHCVGYHQMPDARDPRAAFMLAGVGPDEVIGDFGLAGGGASGYEIDRYDLALGTPPNAMLLATSLEHSVNYPHVCEEIYFNYPGMDGTNDFMVRADLVYFTTRAGGGVFSTSSIAWCGSLSHNDYTNNVSRIMRNVLDRFAAPEPLESLEG